MIEPMTHEPIGLFWKIQDARGNKAYLLGSLDEVPECILKLNSKIRYCFQKAQVLAVQLKPYGKALIELSSKRILSALRSSLSTLSIEQLRTAVSSARLFLPKMGYAGDIGELPDTQLFIEIYKIIEENLKNNIEGYDSSIVQELFHLNNERKLPLIELEDIPSLLKCEKGINLMLLNLIKGYNPPFFGSKRELYLLAVLKCRKKASKREAKEWSEGYLNERSADSDVINRSKMMAERIASIVRSGQISFNVVDADHLSGKENLIRFLEEEGFTVTRKFPLINLNALEIRTLTEPQPLSEALVDGFHLNSKIDLLSFVTPHTSVKELDDFLRENQCDIKTVGKTVGVSSFPIHATPMQAAARASNLALIQHIFDSAGGDRFKVLNFNSIEGLSPVFWAVREARKQSNSIEVRNKFTETVRKLIQLKADINIPWCSLRTPLDEALWYFEDTQKNLPLIRLLLLNGAKIRELATDEYKYIYDAIFPVFERLKWLFLCRNDSTSFLHVLPRDIIGELIDYYRLIG